MTKNQSRKQNRAAEWEIKQARKAEAASQPKAKKEKAEKAPKIWAMGRVTVKGIEILEVGDHNTIEAHSAKINKDAGTRVAFVVDASVVDPKVLAKAVVVEAPAAEDEGEDEDGEIETEVA